MNTKSIFRILFVVIFATAAFFAVINPVSAQAPDPEAEPNAWTASVCSGEAAIVVQGRDEAGDGVTVAFNDPSGCDETVASLGWFVVEPWDESVNMNPDAGCLAASWEEVGVFSQATGWQNGSAWRVRESDFDHPLVVACSEVSSSDELGLNPNERQVELARQDWVVARAIELLGSHDMTPAQYCEQYDEPLADYLCGLSAFTSAENVAEEEVVAPEEPAVEETAVVEPTEEPVAEEPEVVVTPDPRIDALIEQVSGLTTIVNGIVSEQRQQQLEEDAAWDPGPFFFKNWGWFLIPLILGILLWIFGGLIPVVRGFAPIVGVVLTIGSIIVYILVWLL